MTEAISYQQLKLSVCDVLYMEKLSIREEKNQHAVMEAVAVLQGKMKEEMIHEMGDTVLLYAQIGEASQPVFHGRITDVHLRAEGNLFKLSIEAKSFTYDMDITKKDRIFQDTSILPTQVIGEITESYPECQMQSFLPEEAIGELFVQYRETDWEFLCRFASRYAEEIYVDNQGENIRFYAGIPFINGAASWDVSSYTIEKDLEEYAYLRENAFPELLETDMVTVTATAYDVLPLGTQAAFLGQEYIIFQAEHDLVGGLLVNRYHLRPAGGLQKIRYYNEGLTGVSIDGTVLEVQRDEVRAQLSIPGNQKKEKAYWFPYSTVAASEGGAGWYCMPKSGDTVRAYFPEKRENQGYLISKVGEHRPPSPASSGSAMTPLAMEADSSGSAPGGGAPAQSGGGSSGGSAPAASGGGSAGSVPGGSAGGKGMVDPMGDPNVKNITTPSGQELLFNPDGVVLRVGGGICELLLNMDGSVELRGAQSISLSSVEEIKLRAEDSIHIKGSVSMEASCDKGSTVTLTPDEISCEADEIFEN